MKTNLRELISFLTSLFELSQKQADALNRQALVDLEVTVKQKDDVLRRVGMALGRCSEKSIALMNPQTYPPDPEIRALLSLAASYVRRFQAHEKSVLAQTTSLRNDFSRRLLSLQHRRKGITGYTQPRQNLHLLTAKG